MVTLHYVRLSDLSLHGEITTACAPCSQSVYSFLNLGQVAQNTCIFDIILFSALPKLLDSWCLWTFFQMFVHCNIQS